MIKGMFECKVCHRDFPLIIEEHIVVRDVKEEGLIPALKSIEPSLYDAFNCPHCGCQNIMQSRKLEFDNCPCDYGICDECEECKDNAEETSDNE